MSDPFADESFAAPSGQVPLSQRAAAAPPQAQAVPYLEALNPAQREATEALDGPVLVLAGAGTGKTRVLTTRTAHLLNTRKARPNELLCVTFTNKAAREMRERIGSLIGYAVEGMPWLGTFHSVSAKILRRHAELVGLQSNFTILDTDDQIRLLKQLIRADNIDEKRWPARMLAGFIDSWKNRGWTPDKVPEVEAAQYAAGQGGRLYKEYQARLVTLNAADFGDLLLHTLTILQTHDDILAQYQRYFRYILVDEYQDTNVAQYLWLRLLAQGHKNICCVGDDDQSIYGWRGAEVGNILKFEKDFPGATVVRLEQNYRSTPHILAAASGVIKGNEDRLGKTLWTDTQEGEKVRLMGVWDGDEEARWIGEEAEALQRGTRTMKALSLDQMAVLVRASHQMRSFEDRFLSIGMPYRVIGGPRFYERQEIRDAIAYIRCVVQPDDGLAFERIVNTPRRGLGDKAVATINEAARAANISLPRAAAMLCEGEGLSARARTSLKSLVESFERWRALLSDPQSDLAHHELVETILDESGYAEMWKNDKSADAPGRLENLKELVRSISEFENLGGFLEHVSLVMDNAQDKGAECISIMTLHAAKGLEFDAVFLPGWEDGLFPSQRSMDESGKKGLEEERRLAYVGITRARQLCTITFAANRRIYNQWQSSMPSRFVDELPEAHVEVMTPPGLYGGAYGGASNYGNGGMADVGGGYASTIEKRAGEANVYNSPGWKRMQANAAKTSRRDPVIIDARAIPDFEIGDRVFHQKFGYGAVEQIDDDKLSVAFEKAGTKKVVATYVTKADKAAASDDTSDEIPF
jgi:DNA helicase-2/ATP-dependent DNA helicase PcrA